MELKTDQRGPFNNKLDKAEERISQLKDEAMKLSQSKQLREKKRIKKKVMLA